MLHLAIRYLVKQRRRSLITIISMVLAVAMVASIGLMISSLQNMLIVSQANANGSWHYKLTVPPDQTASELPKMRALREFEGVQAAGFINEQHYLQMPGSINYYSLKLLDAEAMKLMPYEVRLTAGRMPLNGQELIISNGSATFWGNIAPLGHTLTFPMSKISDMTITQTVDGETAVVTTSQSEQLTYTIVGTFERFRGSNAPNISEAAGLLPAGMEAESLYLRLTDGGDFDSRIRDLPESAGLTSASVEAHSRYLRWMMQGSGNIQYIFAGVFVVLALSVLLVMLFVIKNSYTLSVVEKSDLYGILRCLNATGKQIRNFALLEGILTWAVALPIGWLAGWLAMRTIISMAANLGVTLLDGLSMQSPAWPYAASGIASFLTMLLSMRGAIKRACAITPVEAFRGNDPFQKKKDKSKPISQANVFLGEKLHTELLLMLRDKQKNRGRFRITVTAIAISVALFTSFAGAAITLTDFMGSYIDKSGMDFYFSSSHHVVKSPELFKALRDDLSQYPEITGLQEVYPIEYLLEVPDDKVKEGYTETWERFYPVDMPFMKVPAYAALGSQLKLIEIIPINRENYQELAFEGTGISYDAFLSSGQVLFCQSEVFRQNGMMAVTEFGTFQAGDRIRVAQRANEEMLGIRELTIAAVLSDTPWFAPERTHGFILVPIETIEAFYEQAGNLTDLYTAGMMSIRGDETQLAVLQEKLYQRSISAFGALNGFVFNSPYINNQDVQKQVSLINLVVYGFVTLIAIICALNIFNTVWADVESRRREIALLRAIGMDSVQMINYLHGGSLMYAVFGMLPGALIGYLVLTIAVKVLQDYLFISIDSPLLIIAGTFAATLAITLLASSIPIQRVRRASIVEEIRAIA